MSSSNQNFNHAFSCNVPQFQRSTLELVVNSKKSSWMRDKKQKFCDLRKMLFASKETQRFDRKLEKRSWRIFYYPGKNLRSIMDRSFGFFEFLSNPHLRIKKPTQKHIKSIILHDYLITMTWMISWMIFLHQNHNRYSRMKLQKHKYFSMRFKIYVHLLKTSIHH